MINHATAIYTIIDDLLKAVGHQEDPRREVTDAEVLTTALAAAFHFGGNLEKSRTYMPGHGLVPQMLSKSRFCRRLHAVSDLLLMLFHQLGMALKEASASTHYRLDSFPVPVCDNIRIARCRLVKGEEFRGYIASKRRYFYGVKVQVVTTEDGIPVEVAFLPGEANDTRGLEVLPLSLPAGSQLFMDSGYTDYEAEDAAQELEGVEFAIARKKNSQRWDEPPITYYKQLMRKQIETTFSQITNLFPKKIHAVTFTGFQLKVSLFIIAFAIDKAFI